MSIIQQPLDMWPPPEGFSCLHLIDSMNFSFCRTTNSSEPMRRIMPFLQEAKTQWCWYQQHIWKKYEWRSWRWWLKPVIWSFTQSFKRVDIFFPLYAQDFPKCYVQSGNGFTFLNIGGVQFFTWWWHKQFQNMVATSNLHSSSIWGQL